MKPGQAVPERSGSFFGLFILSVVRHSFEASKENGKYFRKNWSWGIILVVGFLLSHHYTPIGDRTYPPTTYMGLYDRLVYGAKPLI